MKKWMSLLLCMLLVFGMTVPAAATEESQTNTETQASPETQAPAETTCSHSWGEPSVTAATCTTAGSRTSVCSLCSATITETIPALGHSFGSWISVDEVEHKRVCANCSTEEMGNHTQSSETVTQAATCTAEGKKNVFCLCNYQIGTDVTIPKADHPYGAWIGDAEMHSRACTVCEAVDSGNHIWGEAKVDKEATCKTEGAATYTCSVCAKTKQGVIAKKEHTYDNKCDAVCNVCKEERDADHKFSTVWSKNFAGHWHECSVCGEKKDEEKHFPGPAATEEKPQICLTCKYEMMPRKNHAHEYDNRWSSDAKSHWHACTGCEEQKDYALHTFDNPCDKDCNICGYVNAAAHSYDNTWQSDAAGHWAKCSLCGDEKEKENHLPGPEATETAAQFCTLCGYEIAPALEHTHEFGPMWQYDSATHWQECDCGEKSVERDHTWDEGKEQKGNTIRFTCTECGTQRTEAQKGVGVFWWILLAILIVLLGGAVVALIVVLRMPKKQGKFSNK